MTAHPTAGETVTERLLAGEFMRRRAREHGMTRYENDGKDAIIETTVAIDLGREALALLRVFQYGPSGESWEEWLANVDALLARARGDA